MVVADPLRTPHGVEEILAGAHLGRATTELLEQRELDPGGGDLFVIDTDFTSTEIDHERAERERRGGRGVESALHLARAAQQRVAAGGEFFGGQRDRHGIVGSGQQHGGAGTGGAFVGDAQQVLLARFAQRFVEGRPSGERRRAPTTSTSGENDSASIIAASPSVGALTQKPPARRPATLIRRRSGSSTAIRIRGARLVLSSMKCQSASESEWGEIGCSVPCDVQSLLSVDLGAELKEK